MESCLFSKIVVFLAWSLTLQLLTTSFAGKGVEMGKIFSSRDRTVTESAKIKCQNGRDETPTKSPTGNLSWVIYRWNLLVRCFLKCHREGGRLLGCLLSRNGYQPLPLPFVSNHSTVHNKEGFSNPGLHEALRSFKMEIFHFTYACLEFADTHSFSWVFTSKVLVECLKMPTDRRVELATKLSRRPF